jgi:predicted NBD/HSP70 family sugar kinase
VPRGRRPRFLHLNKERVGIIGINIRPQLTTLALADLDGHFIAQESLPTAADPAQFINDLVPRLQNLKKIRPELTCEGIGVSLPGRVDLSTERLVFAPNLDWRNFDLKTPLEQATGLPIELENAANACALAEIWFGRRSESAQDLVALTVSEGIGTGLVLNHQLVRGSTGVAGEFGHTTIVENGLECRCGNKGCWELYYMGSKPAAAAPSFDDILRLASQGDPKAVEAINKMAHYLGVGISMLVTGLAPDVILVIGEITRLWNQVGPIIKKTVSERSLTHATTRIVPTDPVSHPRLLGTIALVLQKHFGAPLVA